MSVTLTTLQGETYRFFQSGPAPTGHRQIPCFRCGVCCERWQPLIGRQEAQRLADWLKCSYEEFIREYTQPYPLDNERWLLERNERGSCIFLTYDEQGIAACTVHPVKPDSCRAWEASLAKKECRDGLQRRGRSGQLLLPSDLYQDTESVQILNQAVSTPPTANE